MNNTPSSPDLAADVHGDDPVSVAVNRPSFSHIVRRVIRYLDQLLREALVLWWRILVDLVIAVWLCWQWWQECRKRADHTASQARRASVRDNRVARWAPWRSLPPVRRAFVVGAAVFLAVLIVITVRTVLTEPPSSTDLGDTTASSGPDFNSFVSEEDSAGVEMDKHTTLTFDLRAAAERMRSEIEDASPGQWVFLTEGPVLAPGPPARFDGFYAASPAILEQGKNSYHAWYRGCRLYGHEHDCAIGHANSRDGLEWKADDAPAIVPLEGADEFHLGGIVVVRAHDTYFLWYSVAADYFSQRPSSELFLATSADGVQWQQQGQVLAATEQLPRFIAPSAVFDGDRFHLWFIDSMVVFDNNERNAPPGGPFLMHLTSPDGREWQDAAQFPLGSIGLGRVHITISPEGDRSYRAFYFAELPGGGLATGWLLSADGNDWRLSSTLPVDPGSLGSDVQGVRYVTGQRDKAGMRVWFVTERSDGRQEVRAAFYKESG